MNNEASHEVTVDRQAGSHHGVTLLKVTGPLNIRNFFDFQEVTRSDKSAVLLVDLGEVPYMDSAALGSLLGLHVSCAKSNRRYGLVNVSERLQTMFTVCGVGEVLVTFPSVAAAEAALV